MLDKKRIKEKLEAEQDILLGEVRGMGKLNNETNKWEATPEKLTSVETDSNEMADRFEDFEEKSSTIEVLGARLNNVSLALKNLNEASFGKCEVCKKDIEIDRMEAIPSARTCIEHLENN